MPTASPARPGCTTSIRLPAPQAGLISALAQGVIQNNVDWSLIKIGALVGVLVIAADEIAAPLHQVARTSRRWRSAWGSTCRRRAR